MKVHKWIAAVLVFFLLFQLAGCGKDKVENGDAANSVLKTNIFDGTELPIPEGDSLCMQVSPYWDAGARTLTFVCASEDGQTYSLVTSDADAVLSVSELPTDEGDYLVGGTIQDGEAIFVTSMSRSEYRIIRFDRQSGEAVISEDISSYLGKTEQITSVSLDADGDILLLSVGALWVLGSDWTVKLSAPVPSDLGTELYALPDGAVYVRCADRMGGSTAYYPFDKADAAFGEALPIPSDTVSFGGGYDCFYAGVNGVYGMNFADGEAIELLNYMNSATQLDGAGFWFAVDADTMLFVRRDSEAGLTATPILYLRGEDVDLLDAVILHIGMANARMTSEMTKALSDFNRTHADCQVVIDDYTEIENGPDGLNRLALDLVSGVYQPDILIGTGDSDYILNAAEQGYYTDLAPYLEKDEYVNRDNLFDAVERCFDDGKGGIWGITPNFSVSGMISTRENLGGYADKGCWTVTELLDYIEALPDDVIFSENMTQNTMVGRLCGGSACLEFVDGDTCSFDSPDFIRVSVA